MKKLRLFLILIIYLFFNVVCSYADTQNDISPKEVISIVDNYEKAYMNRDLEGMISYVDQNSDWFKGGFLDEFKAVFKIFSSVSLSHFDKKTVAYVADGVEVLQNTHYVAYGPSFFVDLNEFTENYYLKKIEGKYKIAECVHLTTADESYVKKGTAAMLENKANDAVSYFTKAISLNPNNSVARCRLGMLYSRTGKMEDSIQELKKSVELRPQIGFYRFFLSQVYYQSGQKESASEEMTKALALDPKLEIFTSRKQ